MGSVICVYIINICLSLGYFGFSITILNSVSGPTTAGITEYNMGGQILNIKLFNELMCCVTCATFRLYFRFKKLDL